jgi:hypothetical protein
VLLIIFPRKTCPLFVSHFIAVRSAGWPSARSNCP